MRAMKKKNLPLLALAGWLAGCAAPELSPFSEYDILYTRPMLSAGAKFARLPPAVQHTVRAETGAAVISDIAKCSAHGQTVYVIAFENEGLMPPLYVAPDGAVLNSDLTIAKGAAQERSQELWGGAAGGLTLGDLPPAVVRTIQQREPEVEVQSITKQTVGDHIEYDVLFNNQLHPEMRVAPDGTVLGDTSRK